MQIKPVLHRLIVKPDVLEEVDPVFKAAKAAGLAFDFGEREREQAAIDTGVVESLGPTVGRDFGDESFVKVGDRVVYARYGGKAIIHPETKIKYVALNDEDVIAVLTTEGA